MSNLENELTTTFIYPHQSTYWKARRIAFAHIRAIERAIYNVKTARPYVCSGYNADGEPHEIEENTEPFNILAEFQQTASTNPNVVEILTAQERIEILAPITF